mgnify:CR=1 FL=1
MGKQKKQDHENDLRIKLWGKAETPGDIPVSHPDRFLRAVGYTGVWLKFLSQVREDDWILFDVGANVGMYSLAFKENSPKSKVYSFEPIPEIFNVLSENISLNSNLLKGGIEVFNFGFSDTAGTKKMGLPPGYKNEGLYSLKNADDNKDEKIVDCKFENISDFCQKNNIYPDIIKLDVEGSELDILKSISPEIIEKVTIIVVEMNRKPPLPQKSQVSQISIFLIKNNFLPIHPQWASPSNKPVNWAGAEKVFDQIWFNKSRIPPNIAPDNPGLMLETIYSLIQCDD